MAIVLDGTTGISSIGTLTGVTSISSASANTPVIMQDSGSNTNTCRAWVNFNGTGTVAIRASFNVSSITDGGNGSYTVNLSNAMPDVNYAIATAMSSNPSTTRICVSTPVTSSTIAILCQNSTFNNTDADNVCCSVFR